MEDKKNIKISPILKALVYYDVFDYPLNLEEILTHCKELSSNEIKQELQVFVSQYIVFKIDDFYSLQNDKTLSKNRVEGNLRKEEFTEKALKRAKLISKFPYVRGVFNSGYFSKGHMPKDGDVDYFIITKNNRLWLCRTILILYKKIFLFNSRKFFCVNYFLGENDLLIDENNIFTATEIFTLQPVFNKELYCKLIENNSWVEDYYDISNLKKHKINDYRKSWIQSLNEPVFNNSFGELLDKYLMKRTLSRWSKKFPDLPPVDFEIAFKSTRNVSKHHPSNFQKKILFAYNDKINKLNSPNV
jgi:hypothetical protein